MRPLAIVLLCAAQLAEHTSAQLLSPDTAIKVKWLEGTPDINLGSTFGLPWQRGQHPANSTSFQSSSGELQSWVTAYWADGSIKWTGHAIAASDKIPDEYTITASSSMNSTAKPMSQKAKERRNIQVKDSPDAIVVDTGKILVIFPKSGSAVVSSIKTSAGKTVGLNGHLVLKSQSDIPDERDSKIDFFHFSSKIYNTTVSEISSVRALVTVQGIHQAENGSHQDWLPFTLRFYLYLNSYAIRTVHTIVYDGDAKSDFIFGLGIRFDVPLAKDELFDRHVRIAGVDGGFLHEAVQGVTGLRRDPGPNVQAAQYNGTKTPDKSTWNSQVSTRLKWIPTWNDYRLSQLSADGFTIAKRTKAGQSWVKIPGGTRAGGLAYLGGASSGGLAVALRDFWKKYPTGLDISNAATDLGSITLWLYSPSAEPMDLRPYHDGLGEDTYEEQLDALEITYEDYEEKYNTPFGIARTNEVFVYAFDTTPSVDTLSSLNNIADKPPILVAQPQYMHSTKALGAYWNIPGASSNSTLAQSAQIESHMDFLIKFYQDQIEQRRWYGFWDHGDIMHGYDTIRHQWKYDIGGYAWDNSELSPDLFFWNYFLRTGRADVYRIAEAQTRHGGEVDSYHLGNFTGLGTRHGVQHWGDSAKQVRISTPVYRKTFYYLSGGDERTGDLVQEALQAEQAFVLVDARRKVRDPSVIYKPDPRALYLNFGTDWAGVAAAQLLEWERRGPRWQEARSKLLTTAKTFPKLKYGFITGEALYNSEDGSWSPPPTDPSNNGTVNVSHLSAVFGVLETLDQLFEHEPQLTNSSFENAWLDYCYYYGAPKAEQIARYGVALKDQSLRQGHSRLTAYVANKRKNTALAQRAWDMFLRDNSADELSPSDPWSVVRLNGSEVLTPVDEADWITTNAAALYGLAGIELLALI